MNFSPKNTQRKNFKQQKATEARDAAKILNVGHTLLILSKTKNLKDNCQKICFLKLEVELEMQTTQIADYHGQDIPVNQGSWKCWWNRSYCD